MLGHLSEWCHWREGGGKGVSGKPDSTASSPQRTSGEGHHPKSKRPNPCAYTPPSLKGTNLTPASVLWSPGVLQLG